MRRPKYEYRVEVISQFSNFVNKLNEFAKNDWEFVSFSFKNYAGRSGGREIVFRREIHNKDEEM